MNEQIMYYARKPVVILAAGWAAGTISGAVAGILFERRRSHEEIDILEEVIKTVKSEQLELDFDRAEKDRTFNVAIGEMVHVVHAFKKESSELLSRIRDLNEMGEDLDWKGPPTTLMEVEETINEVWTETVDEIIVTEVEVTEDESGITVTGRATERFPIADEIASAVVYAGEEAIKRIFSDESNDSWDFDRERQTRSRTRPYIISIEEYQSGESEYDSQTSLIYYEGDDILVDEQHSPIYNHPELVGDLRFGHGSGDPNIVFVRNEVRRAEYEIIRDTGSYAVEILGVDLEDKYAKGDLRHAHTPRGRWLRDD